MLSMQGASLSWQSDEQGGELQPQWVHLKGSGIWGAMSTILTMTAKDVLGFGAYGRKIKVSFNR